MFKQQEQKNTTKLSQQERLTAVAKGLLYLILTITVLLYGLSLATNLNTLFNPVNAMLNILVAIICYGTVIVFVVIFWQLFSRYMTEALSGLKQ